MKRSLFHVFVLLLTSAILLLTGCSVLDEIFNKTPSEEYKSPSTLAKERQTEIMECFINKDGETLKSFFSEYVIENYPDLDTQIEAALAFLDGEIISYDEPFPSTCGSLEKKDYGATTRNIITDKGTEYIIAFKGWLTNDKEPYKVGTTVISIRNETIKKRSEDEKIENANELLRRDIGQTD